jgi:hypothetical protein
LVAQAKADGEGRVRADFFADGERIFFQRGEGFRPRFAAMDIGAIGEVEAMAEFHDVGATKMRAKIFFAKRKRR